MPDLSRRLSHFLDLIEPEFLRGEDEKFSADLDFFKNRFYPDLKHMGEPVARKDILEWINKLFKSIPTNNSVGSEKVGAKITPLLNGYGH